MGGEPFGSDENISLILTIINDIRTKFRDIKIYVWSGYTLEQLKNKKNKNINIILSKIDFLIDGPFIEEERDISLFMRGSKNQIIHDLRKVNANE